MAEPVGSVAREALGLITGDRNAAYGDAYEDYSRVAAIYNAMRGDATGKRLNAEDCVCVLMAVKLSREAHGHRRDNLVDLIGYSDIRCYIAERESQHQPGPLPVGPAQLGMGGESDLD